MALFSNRKYKTGTRWGFWLWTDVDNEFIRRLHIIKTPFFTICVHWLLKPDPEPYLHDHPVTFLSLILRGGYSELRGVTGSVRSDQPGSPFERRNHKRFNYISATDRHRILEVKPNTVTLCLMGPKTREWGYHIENGQWKY